MIHAREVDAATVTGRKFIPTFCRPLLNFWIHVFTIGSHVAKKGLAVNDFHHSEKLEKFENTAKEAYSLFSRRPKAITGS